MPIPDNEHQTPTMQVLEVIEKMREYGPHLRSRDYDHKHGLVPLQKRIQIAGAQVLNPDSRHQVETEWDEQFYVMHALAFGRALTDALWSRIKPEGSRF